MYKLTLTKSERSAIDWIGDRYSHGHDLYKLLLTCPSDEQWDSHGDVTYQIPEHVAWQIGEMGESDNYTWACFSADLAGKLTDLCMEIV